jgi:hypothetical protein
MPVTVKSIILWRKEVENKPGVLASTLEPFAKGGADLQVLMGYRYPGDPNKAAIELFPVNKKFINVAQAGGLSALSIPTLLVQGNNRPGLGHAIAQATADAGISLAFFLAQVIGGRYSVVLGFETEADAKRAAPLIKKAAASKKS